MVMAMALGSASSDFRDIDMDILFFQGVVAANWAVTDSLALNFGVAIHNRFGPYIPMPRVGFVYRPRDGWFEVEGMLPKILRLTVHTASWLDLELFGGLDAKVWDVNRENLGNRAMVMKITTGAGAKVRVCGGVYLRLAGGVIPFTRIRSYGSSDADSYDTRAGLTPFAQAQISLSPRDWFASPPDAVPPLVAQR